jgi:hypothetical protein
MKRFARVVVVAALVLSFAGVAQARYHRGAFEFEPEEVTNRTPIPGVSLGAALINIVYVPVRVAVTTVIGELGGITGFLLAGDRDGAQDVWGLINGQTIITQDILQGKQEFNFVETYPAPAVLPMEQ